MMHGMSAGAELRSIDERTADRACEAAIRSHDGAVTAADVQVATGLPESVVKAALDRLLYRFDSSIGVAPGGVLVYRFTRGLLPLLRRRPERRLVLRALVRGAYRAAAAAASAARVTFRVVLALQLLLYTFVAILPLTLIAGVLAGIVMFVVMLFDDTIGADLLSNEYFAAGMLVLFVIVGIIWVVQKQHELLREVMRGQADKADQGVVATFIIRVNDLAIGPPVPESERVDRTLRVSLADERRVLARIRAQGGRLRPAHLVRWLGFDLDLADRQATRLAVEHGGEPVDAGDQVLELELRGLLDSAGDLPGEEGPTRFERGPAPVVHSGNTARQNAVILAFAAVNFGAGLLAHGFFAGHRALSPGFGWTLGAWACGLLPAGFSLLLVGLALIRIPEYVFARVRRARELARRALLADLLAHAQDRWTPLATADAARARALAHALGGELDVDTTRDPPATFWRFPRLAAELVGPTHTEPVRKLAREDLVYES